MPAFTNPRFGRDPAGTSLALSGFYLSAGRRLRLEDEAPALQQIDANTRSNDNVLGPDAAAAQDTPLLPPQHERPDRERRVLSPLPPRPLTMGYRVLVDFDGTIAPDDPTDRLLDQFADPEWRVIEAEWQAGRLSSRECMQRQAVMLRATPAQLDGAIGTVRVDPAFPAFVALCRRRAIDVAIVSDGFDRVVGAVLRQARLVVPFYANALEWQGSNRWRLTLPHRRNDCRTDAANCKCAHGRWSDGRTVVIGDGRSDFCMAARAGFVIAKGTLAEHCRTRAVPHATFANFDDVIRHLTTWLDRQSGRSASTAPLRSPGQTRSRGASSV